MGAQQLMLTSRVLTTAGKAPPSDLGDGGSEWMRNWDGCVLELTQFVVVCAASVGWPHVLRLTSGISLFLCFLSALLFLQQPRNRGRS